MKAAPGVGAKLFPGSTAIGGRGNAADPGGEDGGTAGALAAGGTAGNVGNPAPGAPNGEWNPPGAPGGGKGTGGGVNACCKVGPSSANRSALMAGSGRRRTGTSAVLGFGAGGSGAPAANETGGCWGNGGMAGKGAGDGAIGYKGG